MSEKKQTKAHAICLLFLLLIIGTAKSFAWGNNGHKMVAAIAYDYLRPAVRDSIKKYLGAATMQDVATWMDQVRNGDARYDYMDKWHFININKGLNYKESHAPNVINAINEAVEVLKEHGGYSKRKGALYIKVLIHTIGDLHQPLHVGYKTDVGGNLKHVTFLGKQTDLHKVWDGQILANEHISIGDCKNESSKYSAQQLEQAKAFEPVAWLNESRAYLDNVYDFQDSTIDAAYSKKNGPLVRKQIFLAGLRLAATLNSIFE